MAAASSSFRLRTLGPPLLVATDADEPVRFRTRKHLALLIRLAVEAGRPLTRDYLIDLLWGDVSEPQGRHSLAQAISVLRSRLGRANVVTHKATVTLGDVVDTDVAHLERCDGEIGGAFLERFEVPGQRAFDDWKDEMRARLLPRMRDCLVRQMDASRRIGDFAAVERRAEVLLEFDPHSEDAIRGVMEARAWVGDRSNALKAYGRFEARLAEDLGAKPSAQLVRVAHLLREGRPATRPTGGDEPPPRPEKPFRAEHLVGREREFSMLYDAWLAVRRREPRIVVVTGDPGVGKTTLTNAFAATCQLEGAVVARAQAYEAERDLPFLVLAELVRQLTDQRAIGGADPEDLSELTRVCAAIFRAFPGVPKPVDWSAEVTPLRLAQAFWRTVEAAAEESPLLLVVDDIHAADNASAAILHLVARKLDKIRLLVVLTGRPSELRSAPAPAALVSDSALPALQTMDVGPLSRAAAERLLRELTAGGGPRLADATAVRMLRASNGNPLALALLSREWQAQSGAALIEDLERLNTQPAATLGIPRAIGTVFERQRQRLPAAAGATLDLAALLGRRLAAMELYEAAGLSPAEATEALSRLREEGLLREVQGSLEFRNELIRAQAYYAVPAPARRHLHRRVGELLAPTADRDGEAALLETAWHFLRGGDDARGREYGVRGAEAALAVGAPHEAEQMLEVLITHQVSAQRRTAIAVQLATARLQQSKGDSALPLLRQLIDDQTLSTHQYAEVARMLATCEYLLNREHGARYLRAAEVALRAARIEADAETQARALFEYARSGVELGIEERLVDAHEELAGLHSNPGADRVPAAHYAAAFCAYYSFEILEACASATKALSILGGHGNPVERCNVLVGLGNCKLLRCMIDEGVEHLREALAIARRIGDDSQSSKILANLAHAHTIDGTFDRAIECGEESLRLGSLTRNQPLLPVSYLNLAEAYLLNGQADRTHALVDDAGRWMDRDRTWHSQLLFLSEYASLELAFGNVSSAITLVSKAEKLLGSTSKMFPAGGVLMHLKVFRTAQTESPGAAVELGRGFLTRIRRRAALAELSLVSVVAWAERLAGGMVTDATMEDLVRLQHLRADGRRALLAAQGFG